MNSILDHQDSSHPYQRYKIASKNKRLANYLIDLVFIYVFAFIIGIVLAIAAIAFSFEDAYMSYVESDSRIVNLIFGAIVSFIYYCLFEHFLNGKTPGKFLTRTRATTITRQPMDGNTVVLRSASRIVPFETFSFLGDEDGWHDKWSETVVVDETKIDTTSTSTPSDALTRWRSR